MPQCWHTLNVNLRWIWPTYGCICVDVASFSQRRLGLNISSSYQHLSQTSAIGGPWKHTFDFKSDRATMKFLYVRGFQTLTLSSHPPNPHYPSPLTVC